MDRKWWELPAVSLLMLALAILSTYPLVRYFDTAIPFSPFWGGTVWNRSGDQIQLMYWFWLVKENLMGAVPFNSNPYEFNMLVPHESPGLNTIPLAFLYILFSPFGDVAAYNCTILSSYLLAGTFMYLLVHLYSGSRSGALLGAIIFTFAPSRINGFVAGHGYGFLYFLYPFILYFLEQGLRTAKIRYGLFSALGIISLGLLEPHLIYYICVFLGVYIPYRLMILVPSTDRSEPVQVTGVIAEVLTWSKGRSFLVLIGSGIAVVVYSYILFRYRAQNPIAKTLFLLPLVLYPFIPVLIALCLASLYQRLSKLSFRQGVAIEAGSMLPLYLLLPLSALSYLQRPLDATTVVWTSMLLVTGTKVWLLKDYLPSMFRTIFKGLVVTKKQVWAITPVILGMGGVVFWIVFSRVEKVSSTIAGEGRRLDDVGLFSSQLPDVFVSTSNVYIGFLPGALFAYFFIYLLWSSFLEDRGEEVRSEADLTALLYTLIAFCCYILSLGVSFGNTSLYVFFYHYFPFFNYPRVSDRIIILVFFALTIVLGFVVRDIQERYKAGLVKTMITIIILGIAGFQLKDYNVFKPMGINILDKGQDIYSYVKENIGEGLLLEIPLWPGDSHQSSLYQHYIMLDRIPRVNGCSPMVLTEYIDTVYSPLASMNQGMFDRQQFELLHELGVEYVTVHDNRDVFVEKVSPFVPLTTVRRLQNSPYLEYIPISNTMHFKTWGGRNTRLYLFRVRSIDEVENDTGQAWYSMPYIYDPYVRLHKQTGNVVQDKQISSWVFEAAEGTSRPGFMVYGPYDVYPPGDYRSVFTILTQSEKQDLVARAEVATVDKTGEIKVLAQKDLYGQKDGTGYEKRGFDFTLKENAKLEFRVFYYGKGLARVEKITMYRAGEDRQIDFLEAEMMVGNTGLVVFEKDASGGKVIEAVPGYKDLNIGEMVYGPNRIYANGRYTAKFLLRRGGAGNCSDIDILASLIISDEKNQTIYSNREVGACEVDDKNFTPVPVELELDRDESLSFRVDYKGTLSLQLDGIEVVQH